MFCCWIPGFFRPLPWNDMFPNYYHWEARNFSIGWLFRAKAEMHRISSVRWWILSCRILCCLRSQKVSWKTKMAWFKEIWVPEIPIASIKPIYTWEVNEFWTFANHLLTCFFCWEANQKFLSLAAWGTSNDSCIYTYYIYIISYGLWAYGW